MSSRYGFWLKLLSLLMSLIPTKINSREVQLQNRYTTVKKDPFKGAGSFLNYTTGQNL